MIELEQVKVTPRDHEVLNLLKQHLRTLFLRAGIREGRKRVKLAIALFNNQEAHS